MKVTILVIIFQTKDCFSVHDDAKTFMEHLQNTWDLSKDKNERKKVKKNLCVKVADTFFSSVLQVPNKVLQTLC